MNIIAFIEEVKKQKSEQVDCYFSGVIYNKKYYDKDSIIEILLKEDDKLRRALRETASGLTKIRSIISNGRNHGPN